MIKKLVVTLTLALTLALAARVAAQEADAKPNVVPGLKLPDPMKVPHDEGFVTVKAECEGPVEWLVLLAPADPNSKPKLKYKPGTDPLTLDVSVPPEACVITVFCIGIIDGKFTRFARTDVVVEAGQGPQPPTAEEEKPKPATVPFIITVVYDPQARTSDHTLISKWTESAKNLTAAGHTPYLKNAKDPRIKDWLDSAGKAKPAFGEAVKAAGVPLVVIQDQTGKALAAIPCPKTVDELLKILSGGR